MCKKNIEPYVNVTRDEAKGQSDAMYVGNRYIISELISSYAWDTALNFICQNNSPYYTLATTQDKTYGNIGTYSKTNTGMYIADKYSNIYDILGNCFEWTTEYCKNSNKPCVYRGGCYSDGTFYWPAGRCISGMSATFPNNVSFRVQLYLR